VNLGTDKAFRVISTEESRDLAVMYAPLETDKRQAQLAAYRIMSDSVLFRVQEVQVDLTLYDLPGPTRRKVTCVQCGQVVRDHREVVKNGLPYCRPCAGDGYFTSAKEIAWEDMNWAPKLPGPGKAGLPSQPEPAAEERQSP
jgi:formylmethanofuran dehydrogenase subunit E